MSQERGSAWIFVILTLCFVLVAAAVVSTALYLRAEQARQAAEAEAEKARAVSKFMEEMLSAADPRKDGREVRVADVLDQAAKQIEGSLAGQPEVEANLRITIAETYVSLGLHDRAEPHLLRALDLRRKTLGDEHPDTTKAKVSLASLYDAWGKPERARESPPLPPPTEKLPESE